MAKLSNTLDKQQERTAGHSLRDNNFRKSLQRSADNQSPNQIRQLYSCIRFKKAESNRKFSTSREGDLLHLPTFEYENNNITRTQKDIFNSGCSLQIVKNRRLSHSNILSRSNKNYLEHLINSRSIHIINNKTITSIFNSEQNGLTSLMDRLIPQYIYERNHINIPPNSNHVKTDFISQQRGNFSNSNSTMMARPTMVYKLNESIKQVPYPWTVKPMPNQGTKHGKSEKFFTTWKDSSIPHGPEVEKCKIFME
ncbi:MAG: hypothetical protein EZS28_022814 [Streblomastix strix]|uniref:Uncharacterized protein n=1 Tax=Streblomastix strix TaxID=222440 RepID=A0A5J4VGG2_9EUKA|nr:MAG: hypothetical protein EZS28_022814 [Streblomastix strix]